MPQRYKDFEMYSIVQEAAYQTNPPGVIELVPTKFSDIQSMSDPAKERWMTATRSEYNSQVANKTWRLVKREANMNVLSCKWLWRIKTDSDQNKRYKARLVIRGFQQKQDIDYDETFSPVIMFETLRLLVVIGVIKKLSIKQFDYVTAFLNSILNDHLIYMEQPEGFVQDDQENQVCLLQKSLYGLKQAPKEWNDTFYKVAKVLGFQRSQLDWGLFVRKVGNCYVFLTLYVDDMLLIGDEQVVNEIAQEFGRRFKIKCLGDIHYLLGIEINRIEDKAITFSQSRYIQDVLNKFNLQHIKPSKIPQDVGHNPAREVDVNTNQLEAINLPYRSLVGCLQFIAIRTRPDIANAVRVLSKYLTCYRHEHWRMAKKVLAYLKDTMHFGIVYDLSDMHDNETIHIEGYTDSDFANEQGRKSITGYAIYVNGLLVNYKSHQQSLVAVNTTEAELIAANSGFKDVKWMVNILGELDIHVETPKLWIDNQSTISLLQHPGNFKRTKYIEVKYLRMRDDIENHHLDIAYIPTAENTADIFTKALPTPQFRKLREKLGVRDLRIVLPLINQTTLNTGKSG